MCDLLIKNDSMLRCDNLNRINQFSSCLRNFDEDHEKNIDKILRSCFDNLGCSLLVYNPCKQDHSQVLSDPNSNLDNEKIIEGLAFLCEEMSKPSLSHYKTIDYALQSDKKDLIFESDLAQKFDINISFSVIRNTPGKKKGLFAIFPSWKNPLAVNIDALFLVLSIINREEEMKEKEEELKHHIEFQNLITSISMLLSNRSNKEMPQAIDQALSMLGEYTQVARTYIYELDKENSNILVKTHEWCRKDVSGNKKFFVNPSIDLSDKPGWDIYYKKIFSDREPMLISLDDQTLSDTVRSYFTSYHIKSLLLVPIVNTQSLEPINLGLVGLSSINKYIVWDRKDIDLVKMVGFIFGDSLRRKVLGEISSKTEEDLTKRISEWKKTRDSENKLGKVNSRLKTTLEMIRKTNK